MSTDAIAALERLRTMLDDHDSLAVAVSGGVDSLTLATVAGRFARVPVTMYHAVSAAVPPAATERVHGMARSEGWTLRLVRPGELEDPQYVANPVDRCRHCKRALYAAIEAIGREAQGSIVSGANTDDLADYRPGLVAAAEAGVRHPYIEAGIAKSAVRAIARELGLHEIAELPASPCLSSRVETGIPISAPVLRRIDAAEQLIRRATGASDVRCRVRRSGVTIELDAEGLAGLDPAGRARLSEAVAAIFGDTPGASSPPPVFESYRIGSAFLRPLPIRVTT